MLRLKHLLPITILGVVASPQGVLVAQTGGRTDAHALYQMAFDFLFFNDRVEEMTDDPPKRPELLVISDTTADALNRIMLPAMQLRLVPMLQYMFPAARRELIERFATDITVRTRPDLPKLRVPVTFLTSAASDSVFQGTGPGSRTWDRFRDRYPGAVGLTEVSPVVFDSNSGQALVYIGTQRDYVDGQGFILFFERRDGAWRLTAHQSIWVA